MLFKNLDLMATMPDAGLDHRARHHMSLGLRHIPTSGPGPPARLEWLTSPPAPGCDAVPTPPGWRGPGRPSRTERDRPGWLARTVQAALAAPALLPALPSHRPEESQLSRWSSSYSAPGVGFLLFGGREAGSS